MKIVELLLGERRVVDWGWPDKGGLDHGPRAARGLTDGDFTEQVKHIARQPGGLAGYSDMGGRTKLAVDGSIVDKASGVVVCHLRRHKEHQKHAEQ
jgi:hypothetical protein